MTHNDKIRIRSNIDLVAVVPYLLGFHPDNNSIVITTFHGHTISFVARVDLPAPGEHHATANQLLDLIRRQEHTDAVTVIGYGAPDHIEPAIHTFADVFASHNMPIHDRIRVTDGRVRSLICTNPDCCPPEGTPYEPTTSLVAVQATVAGHVAHPNRDAISAMFAPVQGTTQQRMRAATDRAVRRLDALWASGGEPALLHAGENAVRAAIRSHDSGQPLNSQRIAWLSVLLPHPHMQDIAIQLTQPSQAHVELWATVTRHAQPPFDPTPAVLLAITAWRCGNGTLAGLAAEHALNTAPGHRLASAVDTALRHGIPPGDFEKTLRMR
ncbi:DUF4192 domain-containing protein [Micromonospora sp. CPCC 205371]|nr:DUF4192 domain-containing protein [Micromonospora sp. CPCC 205371]